MFLQVLGVCPSTCIL